MSIKAAPTPIAIPAMDPAVNPELAFFGDASTDAASAEIEADSAGDIVSSYSSIYLDSLASSICFVRLVSALALMAPSMPLLMQLPGAPQ